MRRLNLASLVSAVSLLAAPGANAVMVGGLDWRQVTETSGLSWNQVASVCDSASGLCTDSTLGSVSFAGWTWANQDEMRSLFETLIDPLTTQFTPGNPNFLEPGNADIDAAIGPLFAPNMAYTGFEQVNGMTRTLSSPTAAFTGILFNNSDPLAYDGAATNSAVVIGANVSAIGHWMYRTPAPVPLPAAAWLLLSGLGAVGAFARGRRSLAS